MAQPQLVTSAAIITNAVKADTFIVQLITRQAYTLLKKNVLIRLRSWRQNLFHVTQSILVIFLVWCINKAVSYSNNQFTGKGAVRNPPVVDIPNIPDCRENLFLRRDLPCFTFLYTPAGDNLTEALVTHIRGNNDPPIPASLVMGLENTSQVDKYLLLHPQTVLAALHLQVTSNQTVSYILQTNSTAVYFKGQFQDPNLYIQLPLQVALERAFAIYAFELKQRQLLNATAAAPPHQPPLKWNVRLKYFPHPSLASDSITGQVAPVFILASLMFNFVVLLTSIVVEKESGVRAAMIMMGMKVMPYWISWTVPELVLGCVHACLMTGAARAMDFSLVISNSAAHLLLLVFLSNTSLVAMGMTFSTFVQRSSLAVPLSFAVFIIAWVLQLVVSFGFPYNASNSSLTSGISLLFDLFPWTLLSKGILDLAAASSGQWQTGISWSRRSSYCWDGNPPPAVQQDTSQYWQANCHMPLGQIYWVLLVQACVYLSAAVYLDCVLPGGEHAPPPQPWYFLFRPMYSLLMMCGRHTTRKRQVVTVNVKRLQQALIHEPQAGAEDADVAEEAEATRQQCISYCTAASTASQMSLSATDPHLHPHAQPPSALDALSDDQYQDLTKKGLYMFGLQKTYSKRIIGCSTSLQRFMPSFRWGARQPPSQQSMVPASTGVTMSSTSQSGTPFHDHGGHVAVAGVWLRIPEGQCFCLLGPNGAGKTTTLKCLTGAQIPTGGDALVYGHSVCSDEGMQAARSITGVCPQFDVLWGELTAREHMLLYADVKGLPWSQRAQAASELLDKVGLTESADRTVGNFSGGMKRRLSVAMALLGDPRVVYLDEPTTGMDPVSRRQVWDLISACKCNRVVILTTHSMEEADVLGDRIGILASGRLKCLGSSLHLKNRFGSGYQLRLTLACQQQQQQQHAHSKVVTSQDEEGSSRTMEVYEGQPQRGDMFPEMLTEIMSSKLHILEERLKEYFGDQVKIIRGGGKATDVLGGGGEGESDMTESHLQNDSHHDLNKDGGPQPSSDVPDGWSPAPMASVYSVATEASSSVVWTVMVSQDHEQALLCFLEWSKESGESVCGIKDIQLCLTPLEEVYLKVVRLSQAG